LLIVVTPTAAPTPATPKPAAAAPAIMLVSVSSRAATRTLPPALTSVVALPAIAA
jgi:hypothetical protein